MMLMKKTGLFFDEEITGADTQPRDGKGRRRPATSVENRHQKSPPVVDLFTTVTGRKRLEGEWPARERFPLNTGSERVEDTVLQDLRDSKSPLIITGFASLDRIIDFIASADRCEHIRIVFGSEPFDSRRESFRVQNELPVEIKEYWLERGISPLLSGKLIRCIQRLEDGSLSTKYVSRPGWQLHAKIYVGDQAATVGSSNFTGSGLRSQIEANTRFEESRQKGRKEVREEERRRYNELVGIARNYWEIGRNYNDDLIKLLEELLRLVPWKEALARASAELLEGDWAQRFLRREYLPGDQRLWPSQRQGIAQALYILKERGSVLVADATGSGKTKAGIHLIGAKIHEILKSNRLSHGKALLIAPPSVEKNWREESSRASVPVDIYSHGSLSNSKSANREHLIENLRRAQMLCVDEGHNFLNLSSNRSRELLRNMADHVALFTATPINKGAVDLLRIADMLGADNLDDSTIKAFGKLLKQNRLDRSLSEQEISDLRAEIAKFTVRRTKRMLNDLIRESPEDYCDAQGQKCRFPDHEPQTYPLEEPSNDREIARKVRELASELRGVLYFQGSVELPVEWKNRGVTEERYLQGRLSGAKNLANYMVMCNLRSSRAAVVEHIQGTAEAERRFGLKAVKSTETGNMLEKIGNISEKLPQNKLKIELPGWLSDIKKHAEACDREIFIYQDIMRLVDGLSDTREQVKARKLIELSNQYSHILAFDRRPITLALIRKIVNQKSPGQKIVTATGAEKTGRSELIRNFAPDSNQQETLIGLCSDSISEGVNLQRAQVVVHLDMPSVVRIAEQRVGRIDRLDSPHKKILAFWPEDSDEFALLTDERFIERYQTVDTLLGSNMPLPENVRKKSVHSVHEAIKEYETKSGEWDGIEDAFSSVRTLTGDKGLIEHKVYKEYLGVKARVVSRVSLVSATSSWAFFCTRDVSGVPKWILLKDKWSAPVTDLSTICEELRNRLGPDVEDLDRNTDAEATIRDFIQSLSKAEKSLLSRRKQRALDQMAEVLQTYLDSATVQKSPEQIEFLRAIRQLLIAPPEEFQPDWEEVASRWLDIIRPVWYNRLQKEHTKPLLLKDIKGDIIKDEGEIFPKFMEEFGRKFPTQKPPDERIIACIIGVG